VTVDAKDLPRSFAPSTNAGACGICLEQFETGQGHAFYATVRRDAHGNPVWNGFAQVAPKDARTPVRPQGCTCRGRSAHTNRCALYKAGCGCGSRRGRGGRSYVRHGRACSNSISFADRFATLPGFKDHAVHCQCAADRGMEVPADSKVAYGRRVEGHFSTGGAGTAQPVAAAPAPVGAEARAVNLTEIATVAGSGVANAVREASEAREALAAARAEAAQASQASRSWMEADARYHREEREASIRARAANAERMATERKAKAEEESAAAKAERADASLRFAGIDLSDDFDDFDTGAPTSGQERFAALDLD